MLIKSTGKLPSGLLLKKIQGSSNYRNNSFQNLSPTPMLAEGASYWKMITDFFRKNNNKVPSSRIPSVKTDLLSLKSEQDILVWFGHSSYFLRLGSFNILVDPVFSDNAAPVSFLVKAFPGSNIYKASDMPVIDCLIITHDHYDHLDYKTILALRGKVKSIYCSLGISSHLVYWGIDKGLITEFDWWDTATVDELVITAAPARHFSGRGLKRNQTLWSSFIVDNGKHKIYLGGDSGFDEHFKEIGNKYGPFDIALLEAGQYNPMWPYIHMTPEQAVQAAIDLKASALMPVHWGKFSLAMHGWKEPIERVRKKAAELNIPVLSPRIGEMIHIGSILKEDSWWDM